MFISYLMTAIEAEESPYDPENLIPVMFLKCVLSLNLHYTGERECGLYIMYIIIYYVFAPFVEC